VTEPGENTGDLPVFYDLLETKFGFSRTVLRTDYCFETHDDAIRIMGFFFGDEMKTRVANTTSCIIREYTGIWIR